MSKSLELQGMPKRSIVYSLVANLKNVSAVLLAGGVVVLTSCGGISSSTATSNAVAIAVQPLSQTVPIGQTATFMVTASGTAPIIYQWSENGVEISGASSSSYTTSTVEPGNAGTTLIGSFQVTVSNAVNSVVSNTVTLTAGPRSPKAGDLRYLLNQQVDKSGFLRATGTGGITITGGGIASESITNGLGSPLGIGNEACGISGGTSVCGWTYEYEVLPTPMTGLDIFYQPGTYTEYVSDLQSYAASNIVFTSLDLDPAEDAYAVSWVKTAGTGGFDYRIDPLASSGSNQQTQIQAQAALDGTESRVITAASFDAAGNAVLISYGWQGDTTTLYETQATIVPPSEVVTTATNLANQGYIISAYGGNDTNGYILIGMRVQGDSLPRPIASANIPTTMPYYSPVVYFDEYALETVLWEQ